ncbi:MAG: beta-ketoacyl-[acyl-carrier-protein] synthase family protein [Pirellulales bacterium]
MSSSAQRRVVVTGLGMVTPLGLDLESVFEALVAGRSGVGKIEAFSTEGLPLHHGGEATEFTGDIANYGPLESDQKRAIRKGQKVMCRESQMAVAAAQRALQHARIISGEHNPPRVGCVFGSDYMLTLPGDFTSSVAHCRGEDGGFAFDKWGDEGLPRMAPLWLLLYLPNMPASHIAIYNDLQGPSNSLTMREASGHLAIGEAVSTIRRGRADVMLAGATGTRIHPMKTVHALQSGQVALGQDDPHRLSRPFDASRSGMVLGEGAGVFVLEELEHALARGATIHAEVLGHAARTACDAACVGDDRRAIGLALRGALEMANLPPAQLGHVHARGLSTTLGDRGESAALVDVLGDAIGTVPVVAAKSHFGNLGAGSGLVEMATSVLALQNGSLFPLLNYENADPECPVCPARGGEAAGSTFVSVSATPQGQAAADVMGRWQGAAV